MSKIDDELTGRFRRSQRPVASDALFEGLARRRSRRATSRRVQAAALAVAVLGATATGFVALTRAFEDDRRGLGQTPSPAILPANGEIVFSAEGPDGYIHLYAIQPDGSGRRLITNFGTNDTDPAVSPDGRTIAFVHQLEDVPPAIATIPIDGGVVTWLTDQSFSVTSGPSWSPDGSRLVVSGAVDGTPGVFLLRPHGEPRPLVTDPESEFAHPDWSPQVDLIAYTARDAGETADTGFPWTISTITPDAVSLPMQRPTDKLDQESPTWSPDGTRIAFLRPGEEGHEVWTMAPDGGDETLVANAIEATLERDLTWAPDGSSLLVSDGEWIYGVDATPEGDPAANFVQFVRGSGPDWHPAVEGDPASPEPEPSPSPAPTPDPEQGVVEIGLPFRLCDATRLNGVDFLGDGSRGIAWVGIRARENGTCPDGVNPPGVVAADVHGDGIADVVSETIEYCFFCRAHDRVDLDVDGAEELVVVSSEGSTPTFMIYAVRRNDGGLGLAPLLVAEPGHPEARIDPGAPLTFSTGGDEGFAGWVGCDGSSEELILQIRWRDHPIEGDTQEVHETGLVLRDHVFHVVSREDYSLPVGSPVPGASDEPACGVDWQLW
jgi:hypothetical protein